MTESTCPTSTARTHAPSIVSDLNLVVQDGHKFRTVLADPPWRYSKTSSRGAAENHYPTMAIDDICKEPITAVTENDAHLHLGTTNAFLEAAIRVVRA